MHDGTNYDYQTDLKLIASHCSEYESVAEAQGYGYSWLNTEQDDTEAACDDCLYWAMGQCAIYTGRMASRRSY